MIETKTFNYGITCSFDYLVSILSLLCKAIRSSKKDGSEKEKAQEKGIVFTDVLFREKSDYEKLCDDGSKFYE